ncbi:hypothetical protein PQQ51_11645 [Paraburkholderia xenovorans]|uniref:hypothetical protein n=1 Tax=Paraburkholderia xenovorans TaxID=36873 RepID=UPI0038B78B0C
MNDTVPPTIGAPTAAVPFVVTLGVLVPELLPPPHATSVAHMNAPSASFVIPVLSVFFCTVWFPLKYMDVVFTRQRRAHDGLGCELTILNIGLIKRK